MVDKEKKNIVLVLDLDDTLYAEYDYQTSGIHAVGREIMNLYGQDIVQDLLVWRSQGDGDIWGRACRFLKLPESVKESLLWIYRLHSPEIVLDDITHRVLSQLKVTVKNIAILTDGRSISQRKKLRALSLGEYKVYVSEEYNSEKPGQVRFDAIMHDYPAGGYIYVGDNPIKDFVAPNALGWFTVGLFSGSKKIHSQSLLDLPRHACPNIWINSMLDLLDLIRQMD